MKDDHAAQASPDATPAREEAVLRPACCLRMIAPPGGFPKVSAWNMRERPVAARWLSAVLMVFCLAARTSADEAKKGSAFGTRTLSESGLIGMIYDLKQTQKREPANQDYMTIVKEFLESDWDESVLNRYFRAVQPLYATQIFIPLMKADAAPAAFGMGKIIKPSRWVIHYKGQISPPEDGTYRFVGYADDIMFASINGQIVCQGSRKDAWIDSLLPRQGSTQGPAIANGNLSFGVWMELKKDVPVDLDLLIGERPGGSFCAFLLYEKMGDIYPEKNGKKIYPALQMAPGETPDYPSDLLEDIKYWKGYP